MIFNSILWLKEDSQLGNQTIKEPDFYHDLNLDQMISEISKNEEDLRRIFYILLKTKEEIIYRQDVFKDIENEEILEVIKTFSSHIEQIVQVILHIEDLYDYQKEGKFIEEVMNYCNAITDLAAGLHRGPLASAGLLSFTDYLDMYLKTPEFIGLKSTAEKIYSDLSSIKFIMKIQSGRITVKKYNGKADYTEEVISAFGKISGHLSKGEQQEFNSYNHIDAAVLRLLSKIYKKEFDELKQFYQSHINFIDPIIHKFYTEVRFYLSFLNYISPLKVNGFDFCIPEISVTGENIYGKDIFDLVLAKKLLKEGRETVVNDFNVGGAERIIVVTGPNSGGKTTFARAFA
ncbi:MAG: hypothetical protein QW837_07210 [Conexivisphaerales archaeon]